MKYMLMLRASGPECAEGGVDDSVPGSVEQFDERLAKAGVLLAGERLAPDEGVVVDCTGDDAVGYGEHHLVDSPTAVWIVQVASREEAMEWARRSPLRRGCIEVHRVLELGETGSPRHPTPGRGTLWRHPGE
jgi:hypothetical protein